MKNVPNIITSIRLICAFTIAVLALIAPDHGASHFLFLFVSAAVSDMLDGFVARRFNCCTAFGATLDSISDLSLYISASLFLSFVAPADLAKCAPLLILAASAQIFHLAFSYARFKQFPAYHTVYSRCCAYLIFFAVLAFWFFHTALAFSAIGWLWLSTCIEGLAISLVLRTPTSDIDSIFVALKKSAAPDVRLQQSAIQ
jgi:CDP-diacylglycerol--glycerol-3-phosphate 3-phosphatidyltransferase